MLTRPHVTALLLILAAAAAPSCKMDRSKPLVTAADGGAVAAAGGSPVAGGAGEVAQPPPASGGGQAEPKTEPKTEPAGGGEAAGDTGAPGAGGQGQAPPGEGAKKPTNLKVLPKSLSIAQVNDLMKKQIVRGLGVKCSHCHEKGDFASDKNEHKKQARSMMQMTANVDRKFFGGKPTVTCFTCHKGKDRPAEPAK